jgi:hypothetical protein
MRKGRARALPCIGGVAALIALACCGGGSVGGGGAGSTATFVINGASITVTESGSVKESFGSDPAFAYSGPEGCQGRYFTADINDIPLTFRYSSQDAYMIYNRTVYHFVMGPQVQGRTLAWEQTFNGDRIVANVSCPSPPASPALLPPSS